KELAYLSLEDEGYEILEVQRDPDFLPEAIELNLVGCFLTASLIHYSTMRSTMRELRRSPWTFNNHLLMLHHLGKGKVLLKGNYYRSQELVRGFDPILRVNLEGYFNLVSLWNGGSSKEKGQLETDHDLEDSV
ncbi:hypothetical protein Golob_004351, partial [Gossypium lobatum]|nr:hypothetical protein [Gossypium lobatum]